MDLAAVGVDGSAPECANPSKSQKGDGDVNGTKMRGVKKDEHNEKRKYLMLLGISWVRVSPTRWASNRRAECGKATTQGTWQVTRLCMTTE